MLEDFEEDGLPEYDLTQMEYVIAALAYAQAEQLTLNQVMSVAQDCDTAEEFDAGVSALVDLKTITGGKVEAF